MTIVISKASPNYINWIKRSDSTVRCVDLYPMGIDSALKTLSAASALLVTGGEDVYPGLYGREGDTGRCGQICRFRDSLEIALITRALELKMPVFGICRGHQILNIDLGGTLVVDIPTDIIPHAIHRCVDYTKCFHPVKLKRNSMLFDIAKVDSSFVTTNHHQAVSVPATGLLISAVSPDGLPEAIEWADTSGKAFLIGVQWHPERMEKSNPLSGPLADEFIHQAYIFNLKNKNHAR